MFSIASFLVILNPIRFFRFSDLVICGFFVWSDSVRTAAAVVIIYRFTAVPHVLLYSSTINNVLFTAVGRQMSGFEPSLPCFCVFFVFISFFLVGEWGKECLNKVLFTAAPGLQMSAFEPSLPCFCAFFPLFSVLFPWVGDGS